MLFCNFIVYWFVFYFYLFIIVSLNSLIYFYFLVISIYCCIFCYVKYVDGIEFGVFVFYCYFGFLLVNFEYKKVIRGIFEV